MKKVFSTFNEGQTYIVLFKCVSSNNIITLDKQILVNNKTDLNYLFDHLSVKFGTYEHAYRLLITDEILLQYSGIAVKLKNFLSIDNAVKEVHVMNRGSSISYEDLIKYSKKVNILNKHINPNIIPYSVEYDLYCIYLYEYNNLKFYNYNDKYLLVKKEKDYFYVSVFNSKDMSKLLFKYIDLIYGNGFIRNIGNFYMYIEMNKVKYTESDNILTTNKCIEKYKHVKDDLYFNTKIITFNIEYYREYINNNDYNLNVYACGFFDGKNPYVYYLTDYNSIDDMLKVCLFEMMNHKYKGYTIYVHNLSGFGAMYLLKIIIKYFKDIDIINKDNKIICIKINPKLYNAINNSNLVKIIIKDSFKLMSGSLREIGKEFEVKTKKGFFPYSFVNKNNLKYRGNIPSECYFEKNDIYDKKGILYPDFLTYYDYYKGRI